MYINSFLLSYFEYYPLLITWIDYEYLIYMEYLQTKWYIFYDRIDYIIYKRLSKMGSGTDPKNLVWIKQTCICNKFHSIGI